MKFKVPHLVFLVVILWGRLPLTQSSAQGSIEVVGQTATYLFNNWIHFTVHVQSSLGLQEGFVFYQFAGNEQTWVYEGEWGEEQTLEIQVPLDSENQPTPFTELEYWFRFASDLGEIFESQHYTLYYDDNRYAWQTLENAPFTLYWYSGDEAFARSVLAAAQQGISRSKQFFPPVDPQTVILRVYDNAEDVQLISQQAGFTWSAGHVDPQVGMILLSLPPGPQQSLEVQRQVPHEIAHLMLYETLAASYYRLPYWFNEGLASNIEIYSDPARAELLDSAYTREDLIPFFSLCKTFPQDSASARLAYAQSSSFVRYLFEKYKVAGFALLMDAYAQNDDCVNASVADFGKDLITLEAEWRQATFSSAEGFYGWWTTNPMQTIVISVAVALALYFFFRLVRSRAK